MPDGEKKKKRKGSPWYLDEGIWLDLVAELSDSQSESMARLLHLLVKKMQKPKGAFKVRCCLENGRRLIFPFTQFGSECKSLFIESLDESDPLTLAAAMERKRSTQ